jgi:GPH family glycoside/pentoside/hexuronide:cation symporter
MANARQRRRPGVRARLLRHLARPQPPAPALRAALLKDAAAAMKSMGLPMLLAYGAFGLPLAMVALPIYVYLPQFYAARAGLPLGAIGAVLLAARVARPSSIPCWAGGSRAQGAPYARYVAGAAPLLMAGFVALFHPPAMGGGLRWPGSSAR